MTADRPGAGHDPLRVLLVDDEPPALAGMRALALAQPRVAVVGEALSGRDAIRAIRDLEPDLVLLDVQMPEVSGFDVLRAVGVDAVPAVIFVTAYDEFAVRAFEVQAIDYLLKPVSDDRFAAAMERARRAIASARDTELARRLRAVLDEHLAQTGAAAPGAPPVPPAPPAPHPGAPRAPYAERLLVRVGHRDVLVPVVDVDWIEADDYCAVLHIAGKRHLMRETLGALAARLDPRSFVRIHRSAIVSLSRIAALQRRADGGVSAVLRDGTVLPVSRSRRARLTDALGAGR